MPHFATGTGAAIITHQLAVGLRGSGCEIVEQSFNRNFEMGPYLLSKQVAPPDTDIILTDTWCGFAFSRPEAQLVAIEHLFVLDPTLDGYKTKLQSLYHKKIIKKYISATVRSADAIIAVSHYTAKAFFNNMGGTMPNVILNAVDTKYFSPIGLKKIRKNSIVRLLYVGGLSRRKGSDLLAPIMAKLGPSYELYYTSGPKNNDLLEKSENMHFIGHLDQSQLLEQYRKVDLLVFPSRGEGLSCVVMEALACGTPIITSNVSSLPEAVSPEVGSLCPVDDVDAFVEAIRGIAGDPVRFKHMQTMARLQAEKHFDSKRMIKEYKDYFEYLLRTDRV